MQDEEKNVGNTTGDTTPSNEGNQSGTSTDAGGKGSGTPTDQSAEIAELKARLAKEVKDKEIYRAGLLAAKDLGSKSRAKEGTADGKLDSADAKIQEKPLVQDDSEVKRLQESLEETQRTLEALKSSGYGAASTGSGHNENSESKPTGYWSDAQKNELRQIYASRNLYTSDQIDRMIKKAEEIAQSKTATSTRQNDIVKTRQY